MARDFSCRQPRRDGSGFVPPNHPLLTMPTQGIKSEAEFRNALTQITDAIREIPGYLTAKDCHILALLALCPAAAGEIVEIGSFKGRSTVLLSTALAFTAEKRIHACDPFAAPGVAGQDLRTDDAVFAEFKANLQKRGVMDRVTVHRAFSTDLAKRWTEPVRLLWVDGDHSYAGTTADFDAWHRFVTPGGIIALHDVLHHSPGPTQVFANRILLDENWGACGLCGSIGWAQRARSPAEARSRRDLKGSLYKKMSRLARLTSVGGKIERFDKIRYKLLRASIPHGEPSFEAFAKMVGGAAGDEGI